MLTFFGRSSVEIISSLLVYACLFYHPALLLLRYVSIELKKLLTYLLTCYRVQNLGAYSTDSFYYRIYGSLCFVG